MTTPPTVFIVDDDQAARDSLAQLRGATAGGWSHTPHLASSWPLSILSGPVVRSLT